MSRQLAFVYNANSGKVNLYLDILHKIASPSTYPCSLCDLTHGVFKEREEWRRFRESEKVVMKFYHKDEFAAAYSDKHLKAFTYPVILEDIKGDVTSFINKEELNTMQDLSELIDLIKERLND